MPLFRSLRRSNTPERIQAPFAQASIIQTSQTASEQDQDIAQRMKRQCDRFRILIIGRANAGKTTILQKVCGTKKAPTICDAEGTKRGLHDIKHEMTFESNPGYVFHDSRGFESGGREELDDVKAFISARSQELEVKDQLHAIWYCIPMGDDRPFTRAEISFFSECGVGSVPVIAIFTKFDAMDDKAFAELLKQGASDDEARVRAPNHAVAMFDQDIKHFLYETKYPPKGHVLLRDMNDPYATCDQLIASTASAIDNEALKLLFLVIQNRNLALCMQTAVDELVDQYHYLFCYTNTSIPPD
ncbi:hypothetical protein HWV62_14132 [Athelia sp. TMB]|nr:hypothetical protein HWV62_14132 [Athelia sp. TMB]